MFSWLLESRSLMLRFVQVFLSRWALAPVVVARTGAISIRLIVKLDLDEALMIRDCRFGGYRRVAVRLNRQQQPARGFKVGDDVV